MSNRLQGISEHRRENPYKRGGKSLTYVAAFPFLQFQFPALGAQLNEFVPEHEGCLVVINECICLKRIEHASEIHIGRPYGAEVVIRENNF